MENHGGSGGGEVSELYEFLRTWMLENSDCTPTVSGESFLVFDDHACIDVKKFAQALTAVLQAVKYTRLFVVARVKSGEFPNVVWDLQGAFSSIEKAIDACHGPEFCVIPVNMDDELPTETVVAPGSFFPKQ